MGKGVVLNPRRLACRFQPGIDVHLFFTCHEVSERDAATVRCTKNHRWFVAVSRGFDGRTRFFCNVFGLFHALPLVVFLCPQLGEMRVMTDDARLHLQEMERKALMKKICLYATIVLLSILILLVAYREITNGGRLF